MDKIVFTDEPDSKQIIAMISGERERVEFSSSVYAEGNVEHWLAKIEQMMKETLYDCTKQCY